MKTLKNKKQTSLEWFFENIKKYFEHDLDLYEDVVVTYSIARLKEKNQNCLKCIIEDKTQKLFCDKHYIEYLKYVDKRNHENKKKKIKK